MFRCQGWIGPSELWVEPELAGMIAFALTKRKTDALVGVVSAPVLVPGAAGAIAFIAKDFARGIGGIGLLGLNAILIVTLGMVKLLILKPNTTLNIRF